MKRLLYIAGLLSVLCSCEVDITDEFRKQQNLFAVSAQIVAGEAPRINLSRTITMTEVDTLMYLNNAWLEVWKNDTLFVLDPEGEGFYSNEALIPSPGDVLRVQCSGEGLPMASVATMVPDLPQVSDIRFGVDAVYNFTLEVDIEDPASTRDYYSFYVTGWIREIRHEYDGDTGEEWIDTSNVYSAYWLPVVDPVIEYTGSPRGFNYYEIDAPGGHFLHFSDGQINGKKHTLTVRDNLRRFYNDTIPEIYVHVVKKDAHYFNFMGSYIHYDPYPDQDFLQPVQVYTNIEGGFGLLTAESRVIETIDLSEWFSDPEFLDYLVPE